MNLDPFQIEGAAWLATPIEGARGKLLADEPGVGKTRQAIAAVMALNAYSAAVVCPASAVPMWRRETAKFASWVKWTIRSYNKIGELFTTFPSVLIVDEAHYAKTPTSARTKELFGPKCDGVAGLVDEARFTILLSGTPTPNNPSEIWTMTRACFQEAIKHPTRGTPMNFWEFANRYCRVKRDPFGHHKILPGGKRLEELRERLAPYFLRRLKADVYKDMKAPRHSVLPVEGQIGVFLETSDEHRKLQRVFAAKGVDGIKELSAQMATLRRLTGVAKVTGAVAWIEDWFKEGGGPLVVFAYHKDVLGALSEGLRRAKIEHVTGGTPGADQLFQSDKGPPVFLGQVQRDGVVITLTRAQTCLLVEQSWVPGENDQAWQRIHRRGQTGLCDVRWLALAGSIDEDIADALVKKQGAIDALWNA